MSSCSWLNTVLPVISNRLTVIFSGTDSGTGVGDGVVGNWGCSNCSGGGSGSGFCFGVWVGGNSWVGGIIISCGIGIDG